ncbi:prepilin-type N-terminal cleavage/methylation domain-containing protein [Campylobacter concisus]|uniref:Prepilin-type N-terminal cleavage/methylation domain-containing protein n=1 Tax=Campylobacter concisus TaxID=199 RepID=A0A7S9R4Q2_9BACT|nr:prepilin-type N-terminal cleavage/methylation domain-containing protein [Campylobacter concisus]QPH83724.1 prepilin-type N-terminal cleavage/methylation domain-containing protein [Campylobacter concisus]
MKKGFTMIELIFVIVILGILAAVAIPKLAATRDDAEISKTASNIQTLISDLGSYYTSQGEFNNDVKKMSNVKNPVNAKNDKCLEVGTGNNTNGEIGITIKTDGLCKNVWELPGLADVRALIESSDNKTANTLKFGGMGIKYK